MTARRLLVLALAALFPLPAAVADTEDPAGRVRALLKQRCAECHEGAQARAGLRVLDLEGLKKSHLVEAGKPDISELLQLVEAGTMPAGRRDKLGQPDIGVLRDWIKAGAPTQVPPPPSDAVLVAVAADLKQLRMNDPAGLPFMRYVSFHHLLPGPPDADTCLQALTRCLNLLTWREKPVAPVPVDATGTIFRIDLRKLGWDEEPFVLSKGNQNQEKARITLFDLVLLEYPLAPVALDVAGETGEVLSDFLKQVRQVEPVLYLRGDWFIAAALQPPLYDDLLELPRQLRELKVKLNADKDMTRAVNAGLLDSSTTPGIRLVQRLATAPKEGTAGFLWHTQDRPAAHGEGDLVEAARSGDYTDTQTLFSLPNGLPAFFVGAWDTKKADCVRRHSTVARDKTPIGLGLDCLQCHTQGPKQFQDVARGLIEKADLPGLIKENLLLPRYRGQEALDMAVDKDRRAVASALERIHRKALESDPLEQLWRRFSPKKMPGPETGKLLPLDGLTQREWEPQPRPVDVALTARERRTNRDTTVFQPGDEMVLEVRDRGTEPLLFELYLVLGPGKILLLESARKLEPGSTYQYPADRRVPKPMSFVPVSPPAATDQFVLYAAPAGTRFPVGTVLDGTNQGTDRVLHHWYAWSAETRRAEPQFDLGKLVKKTLMIETKVPAKGD